MDENIIEQYKKQMLDMYNPLNSNQRETVEEKVLNSEENKFEIDGKGKLIAIATTFRTLYPVPKAKVTVFIGDINESEIIATDYTDESGRTDAFVLNTPSKTASQNANSNIAPYSDYNMIVEAEGYITNIHLNIPVFSGVTSLQRSNMMLIETAGVDKGPQIFNENQNFDL